MSQRQSKQQPEPPPEPKPEPQAEPAPADPNIPPGTSFDTEEGRAAQGRDPEFRQKPGTDVTDEEEHEREHRRERQRDHEEDK